MSGNALVCGMAVLLWVFFFCCWFFPSVQKCGNCSEFFLSLVAVSQMLSCCVRQSSLLEMCPLASCLRHETLLTVWSVWPWAMGSEILLSVSCRGICFSCKTPILCPMIFKSLIFMCDGNTSDLALKRTYKNNFHASFTQRSTGELDNR